MGCNKLIVAHNYPSGDSTPSFKKVDTTKEAQGERKSLFEYAPSAKVTKDVDAFIDELLGGIENG
ncbi:hypothetical protein [Ligilactobacillus agilis]|uniref:hypothetical protein n=1 Tax=Ligilactobacillus agilis TaxID=1601 RepID=UPI0015DF87B4|nr:hypothetical protein [Ligilactobacillus agilis]